MDSTRVDRWVWAVRLYKTRSAATAACRGGRVHVNGARAKPAAQVTVGDTVRARTDDRERIVEVTRIIEQRVGAAVAADCLIDRSPPPSPRESRPPERERGAGRPTKRDRRQLDRARGRRR